MDQNKSPSEQTSAPNGHSSYVNAGLNDSGPAAKHLNQAKSRRALHAGTQCAAGAHLRYNVGERLPTSTLAKEWKKRGRVVLSQRVWN